jgi:hypothetical protein
MGETKSSCPKTDSSLILCVIDRLCGRGETLISRCVVTYGRIKLGRSAVMSSGSRCALAVREKWAAMQKQEDFELIKSGEGDGWLYRAKSSATVGTKSTPLDCSP